MSLLKVNEVTDLGGGVPEGVGGFTASTTITATDATWTVPALGNPIVKVTVIGGGGGGGGRAGTSNGGTGGTTTFDAGGAGTVTASGGLGGRVSRAAATAAATTGFAAGNAGQGGSINSTAENSGQPGNGGFVTVAYLDLTGISSVNVTIGAGGTAGTDASAGGRGEVIVEYVAG